jgi:hypothetical protein
VASRCEAAENEMPGCTELKKHVDERIAEMTRLTNRAAIISNLPSAEVADDTQREFAWLQMQYQLTKAEVNALNLAYELHRRHHGFQQGLDRTSLGRESQKTRVDGQCTTRLLSSIPNKPKGLPPGTRFRE